jgi:hypothetical protein
MRRVVQISAVALALAITGMVPLAAEASAGAPIKAGEHFVGLVNGTHKAPVVKTVCPGPVGPMSMGPVASKQTMSVLHDHKGHGYTGLFNSIYAWFQPSSGGAAPTQLHFKHYSMPKSIPTSIRVPCGGTGIVVFSSCPYLAPCAAGWVTDQVKVKFEDIAA